MMGMSFWFSVCAILIFFPSPSKGSALTTSCRKIYENALANSTNKEIDFSGRIGTVDCADNNDVRFHCLKDEADRQIELCVPWIFIDPGLCPSYVSYNNRMHVETCTCSSNCENSSSKGCPKETYKSHEFYKYRQCLNQLETVSGKGTITSGSIRDTQKQEVEKSSSSVGMIVAIVIIILVVVAACVIGFLFYRRKKRYAGLDAEVVEQVNLLKKQVNEQDDDGIKKLVEKARKELKDVLKKRKTTPYVQREEAFEAAKAYLPKNKYVVVAGDRGSGKKTFAKDILLWCSNKESSAPIITIESVHLSTLINSAKSYVVMCDASELDKGTEEDKFYEIISSLQGKITCYVFIVVVVKQDDLKRLTDSGKIDKNLVINLSAEEYQMTKDERLNLLQKYCNIKRIINDDANEEKLDLKAKPPTIRQKTLDDIAALNVGTRFPNLCQLFFSDEASFKKGVAFFRENSD